MIHLGAAVIAGLMTATGTNPIWGEFVPVFLMRVANSDLGSHQD